LHTAFTVPEVLELRTSDGDVFLRSTIQFRYEDDPRHPGERKVSTEHYGHTVGTSESLKPGLYSWEWSLAEPRYPHLHVRRGDPDYPGLAKYHIPTGRVFFEDVLRFLIADHNVECAREDWDVVLSESWRRVSIWASWGGRRER